jgi:iron complex transport system substrate-binding protein
MKPNFLLATSVFALLSFSVANAQETEFPLTIDNGGREIVIENVPERAVSLNGHTTEVMLSLGLASKLVGTSYMNHPVLDEYKSEYDKLPVLADNKSYPSLEVLLGADPDFTYGRLSAYRDTSIATVESLGQFGINAYAVKGTLIDGATMDDVYEDITNIGMIFDIQPRANALVEKMKSEIADVQRSVEKREGEPVRVLVFDSGTDAIYTAGTALQTNLIELAGGHNVFDDLTETWANVSWEEAVARAPEVIVINDYGQTTAEQKIALLKNNPALASIPAIQNDRFVVLPLSAMFEGVRIPNGVKTLAKGFYPDLSL